MSSQTMHEIIEMIAAKAQSRPSPIEFEMAYQARVAIDRIRLPIKHAVQVSYPMRPEARGQSASAARDRLERADRRFQARCLGPKSLCESWTRLKWSGHSDRLSRRIPMTSVFLQFKTFEPEQALYEVRQFKPAR